MLLRLPPVTVRVRSPFAAVRRHLDEFYGGYVSGPGNTPDRFVDFDIRVLPGPVWRHWARPQARFLLDDADPFLPLPATQAAPLFEWGLNWSLATRPLGYLVIHAAVLARGGRGLVLPGFPGAGKSTLCAALCLGEGWRLLSDELALLSPQTGLLQPNPRPISLKNASIDIVAGFRGASVGPRYEDTRKGTVAHAAVPPASVAAAGEPARCRWIVFPRFLAGSPPAAEEIGRAEAFARIAAQSFNRDRMGEAGFHALCAMLDVSRCFAITYGSTADALGLIDALCGAPCDA